MFSGQPFQGLRARSQLRVVSMNSRAREKTDCEGPRGWNVMILEGVPCTCLKCIQDVKRKPPTVSMILSLVLILTFQFLGGAHFLLGGPGRTGGVPGNMEALLV